ncbi:MULTISPECIES: peptidoglycan-binding domain-containing protein [Streptomyces]|jgi:peptidoglycan hydrolase-like protein with peptidoglycan-binding domain|uniref:Serine/threonine protein kinase n=1 Tax=Streptomyces bottropensis ATCC 25435 TaxID=1054862 RepID=M3FV75_9ACTN|nr:MULTISPECIES: peptidoglycan-binding domain-containing protein [Streptomyces]EMF56880.1 Serine/threonine protein kinase [Streptomyces bottropensis ATCC 25435]MZD20483.1 serine/threonine protein kinase [Streptomyces sp. SID5476]
MTRIRRLAASGAVVAALVAGTSAVSMTGATAAPAAPAKEFAPTALYCGYHGAVTPPEIAYGSTGNAVREAQCLLQYWGFYIGPTGVDGDFGGNTRTATRDFQATCRIGVDGRIGPITWNRLRNGC